jgi:hypothetical protein
VPLEHSASPAAFKRNIGTLMHDIGKSPHVQSRKQAIAIAFETQRRAGRKANGGSAFGSFPDFYADGGVVQRQTGGSTDPVSAVIAALNAGAASGVGGGAPSLGIGAPNATSPLAQPVTGTQAPPAGVAPNATAPVTTTSPANPANTPTSPAQPSPAMPAASMPATSMPAGGISSGPAISLGQPAPLNMQKAEGGGVANRDMGGASQRMTGPSIGGINVSKGIEPKMPWFERSQARQMDRPMHVGPVVSGVPGRTDHHQITVPGGSYVLTAQHMASMGHGNSLAGMQKASSMFPISGGGGYIPGGGLPHGGGGHLPSPPKVPSPPKAFTNYADGGYSEGGARGDFRPVPVNVAGGEFIIHPADIIRRWGSLKNGHAILDKWQMDERKKEIKTQKNLPPPAKK